MKVVASKAQEVVNNKTELFYYGSLYENNISCAMEVMLSYNFTTPDSIIMFMIGAIFNFLLQIKYTVTSSLIQFNKILV